MKTYQKFFRCNIILIPILLATSSYCSEEIEVTTTIESSNDQIVHISQPIADAPQPKRFATINAVLDKLSTGRADKYQTLLSELTTLKELVETLSQEVEHIKPLHEKISAIEEQCKKTISSYSQLSIKINNVELEIKYISEYYKTLAKKVDQNLNDLHKNNTVLFDKISEWDMWWSKTKKKAVICSIPSSIALTWLLINAYF